MPKYNIGDTVWHCDYTRREYKVPCPDCLGTARLIVILGNGTQIGIDCDCSRYDYQNHGQVSRYEWAAQCIEEKLTGMEINGSKVKYRIGTQCSYRTFDENQLFATKEEAEVQAEIAKAEHEIADQKEFEGKTQRNKTWKSNAVYHRQQARYHQEQLEYHTKKLEIAKAKAKEPA